MLERLAVGRAGEGVDAADGDGGVAAGAGRDGAQEVDCARDGGGGARCAADGAVCGAGSGGAAADADGKSSRRFWRSWRRAAARCRWRSCGGRELPSSTLQTLVRRGLVRIEERPEAFRLGGMTPATGPFQLNAAQTDALATVDSGAGGDSIPFCFLE